MSEGQRVLVEPNNRWGSKLSFVDAIRETGASCAHTAVILLRHLPRDDQNPLRSWC